MPNSRMAQYTRLILLFVGIVTGGCALKPNPRTPPLALQPIDVVFVCQYGYAKSLVAAAHFERMAQADGLPVRVIARGLTPKDEVPEPLAAALRQDGFEVAGFRPAALQAADLEGAEYVLTFGVDLPFATTGASTRWDDVSALSENYGKARDEIVAHLVVLVEQVKSAKH